MTDFLRKMVTTIYQKQKSCNQQISILMQNVLLQQSDEQIQYIQNANASSFQNLLYKSIFMIKKRQSKMNKNFFCQLKQLSEHQLTQQNKNSLQQQIQQKLCPYNKNLKPLKNLKSTNSEKKSFRTRERLKSINLDQVIRLKTQGTPSNLLFSEDFQNSPQSDFKQKNQFLKHEIQRKQRIKQLYQQKNKLNQKLQEINTELINIRKTSQNKSSFELKPYRGSPNRNIHMGQKPFVFLNVKNSHNKLSTPKNNRILNKSSVLPTLQSGYSRSQKINPEFLAQQAQKAEKAVQFITRINRETVVRKLRQKKFQQHTIIENIKDVNLSCSRKRCRKQVLKGKIRQIEK